MNEYVRRGIN